MQPRTQQTTMHCSSFMENQIAAETIAKLSKQETTTKFTRETTRWSVSASFSCLFLVCWTKYNQIPWYVKGLNVYDSLVLIYVQIILFYPCILVLTYKYQFCFSEMALYHHMNVLTFYLCEQLVTPKHQRSDFSLSFCFCNRKKKFFIIYLHLMLQHPVEKHLFVLPAGIASSLNTHYKILLFS